MSGMKMDQEGRLFVYDMGEPVRIEASGEEGHVRGQARSMNNQDTYLVRYKRADGCHGEQWFTEDSLVTRMPALAAARGVGQGNAVASGDDGSVPADSTGGGGGGIESPAVGEDAPQL